jgi:hypothetical protein
LEEIISGKSKAFKRYVHDLKLKDKNLAIYDSVKSIVDAEDKGDWHEY